MAKLRQEYGRGLRAGVPAFLREIRSFEPKNEHPPAGVLLNNPGAPLMQSEKRDELVKDFEDLATARKDEREGAPNTGWIQRVGPGLITGAADDDPSGVGTYSAIGAQFGYFLLWLVPFCIPLMIAVQEMCGRIAAITGKGLASVIKERYPAWQLYTCVSLLIIANIFNVFADLNVMAASLEMLFRIPFRLGLLLITAFLTITLVFIPYRSYAKVLKWLCLALLGYVVVAFMPGMKQDWGETARNLFVPHLNLTKETMLAVVAFFGTTISPYLFFWQAGETVEEQVAERKSDEPGSRTTPVSSGEIRRVRADTAVGMIASQIVALFIVVAAARTLHSTGKIHIQSAQDAARALEPLGPAAYWIFSLCIIGTGLLAIPTLAGSAAYSVSEALGWRYGLYRRFARAKGFYITVIAVIVIGMLLNLVEAISPVDALVYSSTLNGIISPPLIIMLISIGNDSKIVGTRTNSRWTNFFSWLTVACMVPAAIYVLATMI